MAAPPDPNAAPVLPVVAKRGALKLGRNGTILLIAVAVLLISLLLWFALHSGNTPAPAPMNPAGAPAPDVPPPSTANPSGAANGPSGDGVPPVTPEKANSNAPAKDGAPATPAMNGPNGS
jgi:hypothetical protein